MRPLVLLSLLACGGGHQPPPESPPPAASLLHCAEVADHVATTLSSDRPQAAASPVAVKDLISTRCTADAWSDETRRCLYAIKTIREGRACATGMTEAQRDALRAQARSLRAANATPPPEDDPSDDWIRHVVGEPDVIPR